jgi:hypothetical protein
VTQRRDGGKENIGRMMKRPGLGMEEEEILLLRSLRAYARTSTAFLGFPTDEPVWLK